MEITLTLDDELVEQARGWAELRQKSLDELFADYLRRLFAVDEEVAAFVRRATEQGGHAGPGYCFNREECYDRSAGV